MAIACTSCGTDLPDGAAFCPECGNAAAAAVAPLPPPPLWPSQPPAYPPTPAAHPPTGTPVPPGNATAAGGPAANGASTRNTVAGVLGLVGAVVLGVSSFLVWARVTLAFVDREQTVSGWDWFDNGVATGPLFAVLALTAAALAGLVFAQVAPPAVRIVVVAVGGLSLGLAAFAISDILRRRGDLQSVGQVDVSLQAGIWLLLVGAGFILVSGLVATEARRSDRV